jgi:hypothetical protein
MTRKQQIPTWQEQEVGRFGVASSELVKSNFAERVKALRPYSRKRISTPTNPENVINSISNILLMKNDKIRLRVLFAGYKRLTHIKELFSGSCWSSDKVIREMRSIGLISTIRGRGLTNTDLGNSIVHKLIRGEQTKLFTPKSLRKRRKG